MDIRIKYFGAIADVTGKKEESFPLQDGSILLSDLNDKLTAMYPGIKSIPYSIAVNQAISKENAWIYANDEVAFLPPFAGG